MRSCLLCWILIVSIFFAQAQDDSIKCNFCNDKAVSIQYQRGYIFQTNDFLKGENALSSRLQNYQDLAIRFSHQSTGENEWEQRFNYPEYGVALYMADFFDSEEIGYPIAVYGFFDAPFVRWSNCSFDYEIGAGLTSNWKKYDPITNQYNTSIGGAHTFYISCGLHLDFNLDPHWVLIGGVSLTHFSNGKLKIPNFGINTVSPKIALKYRLQALHEFKKKRLTPFRQRNVLDLSMFYSIKNLPYGYVDENGLIQELPQGIYANINGFTTCYSRFFTSKSKVGFGFNITYNQTAGLLVAYPDCESEFAFRPLIDKIQMSFFPSYELTIHKLSLVLQPSFYVYRTKLPNQSPIFHQRIGLNYHFNEQVFASITLRAYSFRSADFIEWTLGYSL